METQFVVDAWRYAFDESRHGYPEWVVSGVLSFILHEMFYFGAYLPYLIADQFPSLRTYKLQADEWNTWPRQWNCLRGLMINHFLIQMPLILLSHPVFAMCGIATSWEALPSWGSIAWQIVVFFLIEDFYFYWVHRLLHWGPFYRYIHKVHHLHAAPFGIAAEYAHPIETMFLGIGTVLGPFFFATHLFTIWVWLFVRLLQTVEVHSGYDFPWSLNNWLPGWGGAEFHDYHHMAFNGNYASTFRWWDRVFATDTKYLTWRAKQKLSPSNNKKVVAKGEVREPVVPSATNHSSIQPRSRKPSNPDTHLMSFGNR